MGLFSKVKEEVVLLPVGLTEFHEWADKIIALAGKFADEDSMKFALASMIQHLKHDEAKKPLSWFADCLRKAAANQVAAQVFLDIKEKQAAAAKAAEEAAKQAAEVTAPPTESVASNGQETTEQK